MKVAFFCRDCQTERVGEYPHTLKFSTSLPGATFRFGYVENFRLDEDGHVLRPQDELQCGCGGWCNCLCEEGMEAYLRLNGFPVLHRKEITG
jgi:hypothetical protein